MDDTRTALLILAIAVLTYLTRIGGHLVLSRFRSIHPRVEAALQAVPAAVMTTLVVPAALSAGPAEMVGVAAAVLASFRLSAIPVVVIGLCVVIGCRWAGL